MKWQAEAKGERRIVKRDTLVEGEEDGSGRLALPLEGADVPVETLEEEALVFKQGLQGLLLIQHLESGPELWLSPLEIGDGPLDVLSLKALAHGHDLVIEGLFIQPINWIAAVGSLRCVQ